MVWNHRVVRQVHKSGEVTFAVHEAYYEAVGAAADTITNDPIAPMGETIEELRGELTRMLKAMEHPVLEYDSFNTSLCPTGGELANGRR